MDWKNESEGIIYFNNLPYSGVLKYLKIIYGWIYHRSKTIKYGIEESSISDDEHEDEVDIGRIVNFLMKEIDVSASDLLPENPIYRTNTKGAEKDFRSRFDNLTFLKECFNDEKYSDIVINCNNCDPLYLHKIVLNQIPFFKNLFKQKKLKNKLNIECIPQAFYHIFNFIYTKSIDIEEMEKIK